EAKLLADELALRLATGNANHSAPFDLADLPYDRADGTRRRGDHQRLTLLGLANVREAGVGGEARHAEHPEGVGEGPERGVDLVGPLTVRHGILLPPLAHVED